MRLKVIFVLLLILLLVGAAVADAKSSGRAGRSSGFGSKSISIKPSFSNAKDTAKIAGISTLPGLAKNRNLRHKDDIFENETEDDMTPQSPSAGLLPACFR